MTANVEVENVSLSFGGFKALRNVSLNISAGEFVVLLGPSGCGKTTLLSILGGFLAPTEGHIRIGGREMNNVAPKDRPTTTMFQDYALFPHMTLLDNVGFGLRMRGLGRRQRNEKAEAMLDMVGLSSAAARRPHELSGGQRQRVALARALAVNPDVLLLDEPLGALDLKLRRQMQDELKQIQRRVGTTFVHVTHDQEEAMSIADRIVVMSAGRIEDQGPPQQVYLRPKTLFSAGFMGEMNQIAVTVDDGSVTTAFGKLPLSSAGAESPATLCVRPENIGIVAGGVEMGPARMVGSAFFGTHHRCHFTMSAAPEITVVAHLPQHFIPVVGMELTLFAKDPIVISGEDRDAAAAPSSPLRQVG
ncbi:ABC transporter ATP-binding protein [Rhizobium sp. CCGE 510]|uniref:ABC transporter ATP-binding protein n=1 Tax=Rhizobium sp. CCGE 510 TaxID=1132836 RepID=UPI00027B817C|nr:spermidine/putrescine transport system ATP-binding protein [Rhizobium sp. CCGE 510]